MTATHTFEGTPASGPNNGKTLRILQLYPLDMNIYGDWGNTLALARRAQAHGFDVQILDHNPGQPSRKMLTLFWAAAVRTRVSP